MKKYNQFFNVIICTLFIISIILSSQCSSPEKPGEDASIKYKIEAADLYDAYSKNEEEANQKFLNRMIEVSGPLASIQTDIKNNTILFLLDDLFGIRCSLDSTYSASNTEVLIGLSPGENISVKGKCNGLQSDVQLSECVILNSKE